MRIEESVLIEKVRTAIDDIMPELVDDDFNSDTEAEILQAVMHSIEALLMELPSRYLEPSVITSDTSEESESSDTSEESEDVVQHGDVNGSGTVLLPDGFLRLLSLMMEGWSGVVHELIEPGSEEEKQQRSSWSRGSRTKPIAMLDVNNDGKRVVRFWPDNSGDYNSEVSNGIHRLVWVPMPKEEAGTGQETGTTFIVCALKDECKKAIIYRAASIFLEGKKEHDVAEQFKALSITGF